MSSTLRILVEPGHSLPHSSANLKNFLAFVLYLCCSYASMFQMFSLGTLLFVIIIIIFYFVELSLMYPNI